MATDELSRRIEEAEAAVTAASQVEAEAAGALECARIDHKMAEAHLAGATTTLEKLRRIAAQDDAVGDARIEDGLASMDRTEALIAVLRRAEGPLGVEDIKQALREGGRVDDSDGAVRATLHYLKSNERIRNPMRGRYSA